VNVKFFLLILSSLLCLSNTVNSQTGETISINTWVKKLSDPDDKKNEAFLNLISWLGKLDITEAFNYIDKLEEYSKEENKYYLTRLYCVKSYVLIYKQDTKVGESLREEVVNEVCQIMEKAMHLTYELNDDYLEALVSGRYGFFLSQINKTELSVMYMMNSAELYDKIQLIPPFIYDYISLSGMLWYIREYNSSIKYGLKTIGYLNMEDYKDNPYKDLFMISCYNTIALSYQKTQKLDSAFVYYQKGLDIAKKINSPVWEGIISGNIGQIYYAKKDYKSALPLFEMDYTNSTSAGEFDNAANSLQWAARTNLKLDNKNLALKQIREAFILLQKLPKANYLANIYNTNSEIFEAFGNKDSVIHYSSLYNKLNDSLEKTIYQSSISISKLRLNEEKNRYDLIKLQHERQQQVQQRNFIIGGILFATFLALLFMNRKWNLANHQKEMALKEKELIEHDMASAREQLKMFTNNMVEKTSLIETLKQQLTHKTVTAEEQLILTELSQQTILTEDDWDNFKVLFDKVFPLFFIRLKSNAMDITMAEQRMAALTRLQLTTKQMASMLGISIDSVHKTKQRLRKRFNLPSNHNLEEFIANI